MLLGGLPYRTPRDGILTHPAMAEGLNMLVAAASAVEPNPGQPNGNSSDHLVGDVTVSLFLPEPLPFWKQ